MSHVLTAVQSIVLEIYYLKGQKKKKEKEKNQAELNELRQILLGSKVGAVVRALASHQCGPGSNPGVDAICRLSLLLVLPCSERFFSRYSGFPLSSKTNISKFEFDPESGRRRTTMWMRYLQIVIYLFAFSIIPFFNLLIYILY